MVSKKDEIILSILQNGARTPISEVAKTVGLSENGVRYRLEKLEDEGYIKNYTVLLNPKKFGKRIFAIFNLEMEPKKTNESIKKLIQIEELIKIYQTTGQYSIKAFGLFNDEDELTSFINNRLLCEIQVRNYSVEIITKSIKDSVYHV
ncbi:Lrp/AsnC family transcriptional regulator [Methanolobus psychrotolerans]|uniref:Lrp/AsnC family transcriptional regulator n=1 Tax=Methanolobus psychrotolerans TaxID=1874706 RepID=UPI000B91CCA4|nr:Lrp/AsnC family transcriptional regulator [Methanolobus psychrotolerans]